LPQNSNHLGDVPDRQDGEIGARRGAGFLKVVLRNK